MDLHANLTDVQGKLLEVLRGHMEDAKIQESQQQGVQKHWKEFTMSLEQNLDVLSTNTTTLLRDLFSGLLRLQSFTRDSTRFVAEELNTLEQNVRSIRGGMDLLDTNLNTLGNKGIAQLEQLSDATEEQLMLVKRIYVGDLIFRFNVSLVRCTPTELSLSPNISAE